MSPRRKCIICSGFAVEGTSRCPTHTKSNWGKHKARHPDRSAFYSSRSWRDRAVRQLREYPTCAVCGEPASDADHIVSLGAGGDPAGPIQSLCAPCHRSKTAREGALAKQRKRRR